MTLMPTTAAAVVFRAGQDQLEIVLGVDGVRQGLPEAGPTGTAVVFRA